MAAVLSQYDEAQGGFLVPVKFPVNIKENNVSKSLKDWTDLIKNNSGVGMKLLIIPPQPADIFPVEPPDLGQAWN